MEFDDEIQSLPQGWTITTLGQLCDAGGGDIQTGPFGSQLHASDYVEVGIPSIMPTNFTAGGIRSTGIARIAAEDARRLQKYRVATGDIVYSRRGDVEKCALVTSVEDGWLCGTGCLRVRLGNGPVTPKFLQAYLSSPPVRSWVVRHAVGATMPNLNTSILRNVPVVVPSHDEMAAIGEITAVLREKMTSISSENELLESMTQTIFRSWFIDFDPTRAKAEGLVPSGIDTATAALFPDEFEERDSIGIPRGWILSSVGDLCSRVSMGPFGSDIKTDNFLEEGVPVIRGKNLGNGFIDGDFVYLSEQKADQLKTANAFGGDIVITHRGTLGQVGLIPLESRFPRYVVSQSQMVLSVLPNKATPAFLYCYLISSEGQHRLLANTSQTGVPAISRPTTSVRAMEILLPDSIRIIEAFDDTVRPLMRKNSANVSLLRTLAELRDTLLPRLISGKLRIPEAEKMLETVA
jgi:type I restriction enzyme S subunit